MTEPKIVEITGPTGVGKSTLTGYLRKHKYSGDSWVLAEDLLKEIEPGGKIYPHLDPMAGRRFYKQHPDYRRLFREVQKQNIRSDTFYFRNKRAIQLYKVLCEVQMIDEYYKGPGSGDNRICVYEEGLVFKSFSRVDVNPEDSLFRAFAGSFPLPSVVIHLEAPSSSIAQRAWEREKTAPVHYGLGKEEIRSDIKIQKKRSVDLHDLLRSLGVEIHYLSMSEKPETVLPRFMELMDEIAARQQGS